MFDFIIIDAPPLGIFTDANVLNNRADAALMVVVQAKLVTALSNKLVGRVASGTNARCSAESRGRALEASANYYQNVTIDLSHFRRKKLRLVVEEQEEVAIAS